MNIVRSTGQGIILDEIGPLIRDLLLAIPTTALDWELPEVAQRIFSPPTHQEDKELRQDWQTYVRPELEHLFKSANEVVRADLATIAGLAGAELGSVLIPASHLGSWLNSLNQARLVLASRNGFDEVELNAGRFKPIASARDLDLFRIHFYAYIQEYLVDAINSQSEGETGESPGR